MRTEPLFAPTLRDCEPDGEADSQQTPDLASGWFALARETVFHLAEVGGSAAVVYLVLAAHADGNGCSWPSIDRIRAVAKQTKRSTLRAIRELEAAGLLTVDRSGSGGRSRPNTYRLGGVKREPVLCENRFPFVPKQVPVCPETVSKGNLEQELRTTNKNNNKKARRDAAAAVGIPSEIDSLAFREAWARWVEYRAELKKRLTPKSAAMQLKMLAGLGESAAIESIEQSIRNGWQGLFEPKGGNGKPRGGLPTGPGQRHAADAARQRQHGVF